MTPHELKAHHERQQAEQQQALGAAYVAAVRAMAGDTATEKHHAAITGAIGKLLLGQYERIQVAPGRHEERPRLLGWDDVAAHVAAVQAEQAALTKAAASEAAMNQMPAVADLTGHAQAVDEEIRRFHTEAVARRTAIIGQIRRRQQHERTMHEARRTARLATAKHPLLERHQD